MSCGTWRQKPFVVPTPKSLLKIEITKLPFYNPNCAYISIENVEMQKNKRNLKVRNNFF
jgi:hypothetical protein